MLKYLKDEDEYKIVLGIISIPDTIHNNFNKLNIEASNYINSQTHDRVDLDNIPDEVKYVTCLIIDLISNAQIKKDEIGNLASQNIEGWSESYIKPEEIDSKLEVDKYNVLKTYLWNLTGIDDLPLLYRGK